MSTMTKPKTKLTKKELEAYKVLSDKIGSTVLELGYNAIRTYNLNEDANQLSKELQELQIQIKEKYGCAAIDFKNNVLRYEKAS